MPKALFLDRDGIINVDRDYVYRIDDFVWQPGIIEAARTAVQLGLKLVVVTNQSGIGRGYYREDDFQVLTAYMRSRFADEGAELTAVYHAPHHPQAAVAEYRVADHPWRKPRPGMILAARDDLGLDLAGSLMVGDRYSDIAAGTAAGVGHLALVGWPKEHEPIGLAPFTRLDRVADLSAWIARTARKPQA